MQTLTNDMAGLMSSKRPMTFAEAVGCDTNTSFDNGLSYQVLTDNASISTGGLSATQGGNMQITIRHSGVLLNVARSSVSFLLTAPANSIIRDARHLFQLVNCQLGQIQWSDANQQKLNHLLSCRRKKDEYAYDGRGMLIRPYPAQSGATPDASMNLTYDQEIQYLALIAYESNAGVSTYKVSIPLNELIPQLKELADDMLYLGVSQAFIANFTIMPLGEVFTPIKAADIGNAFKIENSALNLVYTQLDVEREQAILRNMFPIPVKRFLSVPRPMQDQITAQYNLSKGQRLRAIWFGVFRSTVGGAQLVVPAAATILQAGGNYVNRTSSVCIGIQYLSVSINGYQYAMNTTQLQQLSISGSIDGKPNTFYDDEVMLRCHNFAYCLDLTRFGAECDWFGSGEQQSNTVQLNITWSVQRPFFNAALAATDFPLYTFQSFFETVHESSCTNGLYTN